MKDWIQGEKFIGLATYTYSPKDKVQDDYDNLPNTLNISSLKDGDIIYTHTMYVDSLFAALSGVNKKLVIISHNGDNHMGEGSILPENLIKWYSQNVNVKNPKIESIPIGLENDRWSIALRKRERMLVKTYEKHYYKNLVYMNHNIETNPDKRQSPYQLFKNTKWVTTEYKRNGQDFDSYIDNVYNHRFMICPEGNGIDTHRTWECLYMGTIPIEIRNINNQFYMDLPILFVDGWEQLTEEFLWHTYQAYQRKKWNMEKLTFEYWKNKILCTK